MSKLFNRARIMLGTACMVGVLATSLPAIAASPKTKTVEGTITKWSAATSSFQTKATIETWTFSFDKTKLQEVGTPKMGAFVKITYHMNGKSYVADKVVVEKNPK